MTTEEEKLIKEFQELPVEKKMQAIRLMQAFIGVPHDELLDEDQELLAGLRAKLTAEDQDLLAGLRAKLTAEDQDLLAGLRAKQAEFKKELEQ